MGEEIVGCRKLVLDDKINFIRSDCLKRCGECVGADQFVGLCEAGNASMFASVL